jgi:hypothetical protein
VDWPDYFPTNCPPQNARSDNLKVYRLVDSDPPNQDDFIPNKLLYPHIDYTGETLCLACGISVDKTLDGIKRTRKRFRVLRNKKIAVGTIKPNDGVILETGSGTHVTWWVQTKTPHVSFKVVNEDAK